MVKFVVEQDIKEEIRNFKRLMETGELPTTEGQSSGRRKEWTDTQRQNVQGQSNQPYGNQPYGNQSQGNQWGSSESRSNQSQQERVQ
jgi:hypothetical protein